MSGVPESAIPRGSPFSVRLRELEAHSISPPMSLLQKCLLTHGLSKITDETLETYNGITIIFQDFISDEITKKDMLEKLMSKGGNAFFNHFLFSMYYGTAWNFLSDFADSYLYLRDFTDYRCLHMAAFMIPYTKRMLFRYIIVRVRDKEVLQRGEMWYRDPKQCLFDGVALRFHNGLPQDRGDDRAIVMVESVCQCLFHAIHLSAEVFCRCCRDINAFLKRQAKF